MNLDNPSRSDMHTETWGHSRKDQDISFCIIYKTFTTEQMEPENANVDWEITTTKTNKQKKKQKSLPPL